MSRWMKIKTYWRLRSAHLFANAWGLCLGLLAMVSSLIFFIDPNSFIGSSSIGLALHSTPLVYAWTALYGAGGTGMVVGLLTLRPDIDVAGLCCFAAASIIQIIGIVEIWSPLHWLGIFTYACLTLAAFLRAWAILRSGFQ